MVEILVTCLFFSFKQLIRLSLTFFLIIKMDKRKDDNKNEICLDHHVINLVMFSSISPCDLWVGLIQVKWAKPYVKIARIIIDLYKWSEPKEVT